MKIISFNINGLRARLHQLEALIAKHQPDIIGLQEIKVDDSQFPQADVEAMGYHVYFHGQKGHYGVALMSKTPLIIEKGLPNDADDAQRRLIRGQLTQANGRTLTVYNGYFPQGENRSHETKFPAKQRFYAELIGHLQASHQADDDVVVMGDINISPEDLDIGIGEPNRKRWLKDGKCSFLPEEREWLAQLKALGYYDSFRQLHPTRTERYSWFDYRSKGFDDNRGLRIDVVMLTAPLQQRCLESDIDYEIRAMERPSDHAPVYVKLN